MNGAKNFKELIVWQKAHAFVVGVYKLTDNFPKSDVYGLTSQFRRAAISIAANIADGFKKFGKQDKIRFLNIAQGSVEECRYYLILANDLNYGFSVELEVLIEEVSKLLASYSNKIQVDRIQNSEYKKQTLKKFCFLCSEFLRTKEIINEFWILPWLFCPRNSKRIWYVYACSLQCVQHST
ncbi:MAG: four helix bundle protein [Ignavibacteriales bacterium]|nr:four helix bundle protein [Ignavibacteriales bacterium]